MLMHVSLPPLLLPPPLPLSLCQIEELCDIANDVAEVVFDDPLMDDDPEQMLLVDMRDLVDLLKNGSHFPSIDVFGRRITKLLQ